MKRLLLAGLAAGAALSLTAPASATIIICNNMPVMVQCYSTTDRKWCNVWIAAINPSCINTSQILGPVGA